MLSTIGSIASIISGLGVIAGIFIAIAQLKKTANIAAADHSRRRKEATINFFDRIRDRSTPLATAINKVSNGNPVTVQQIEEDPDLKRNISQYLSLMERLAVGIYADVFDYEVYRELYKTVTVNRYHQLREYIRDTRVKNGNPKTFDFFERLAQRLENESKPPMQI